MGFFQQRAEIGAGRRDLDIGLGEERVRACPGGDGDDHAAG